MSRSGCRPPNLAQPTPPTPQGAMEDCDAAVARLPNDGEQVFLRSLTRERLGDFTVRHTISRPLLD